LLPELQVLQPLALEPQPPAQPQEALAPQPQEQTAQLRRASPPLAPPEAQTLQPEAQALPRGALPPPLRQDGWRSPEPCKSELADAE
jgi:hypothetical protein